MEKLTRNNRPFLDTTITSNKDICGQENYEKQLQVFSIVHFSCLILVFKWLKMQLQVIKKKKKKNCKGLFIVLRKETASNIQPAKQ